MEAAMSDEDSLRSEILRAAQTMWQKGYVVGAAGNISARIADSDRIVITPSGAPYDTMKVEDLVVCTLGGEQLSGAGRPSSELFAHVAIYQARPEVQAIVHTHSPYATALAVNRTPIPFCLDEMYYSLGPRAIPVTEFARGGTQELAKSIVKTLGRENKAVLVANHGTFAVGADIREAFEISEEVEKAAMIYILARLTGQVHSIASHFGEST
jgi:L-fuculose-phosphate aldolase